MSLDARRLSDSQWWLGVTSHWNNTVFWKLRSSGRTADALALVQLLETTAFAVLLIDILFCFFVFVLMGETWLLTSEYLVCRNSLLIALRKNMKID